jgi:heme/copper-type cytochrome/quinol oxidase subunit 2
MCWEVVVVVVVVIIVMVVVAGAQNKKKKRLKKCASKATTSGPDVRVNSHVAAITVVIFTTKAFFSFLFLFRTNLSSFICMHSC